MYSVVKPAENLLAGEQVFLHNPDMMVTRARAVILGTTYPMVNITSVAMVKEAPNYTAGGLLLLAGMLVAGTGATGITDSLACYIAGAVLFLLGLVLIAIAKPKFIALLRTASGESKAMTSRDQSVIKELVEAINQAIATRG